MIYTRKIFFGIMAWGAILFLGYLFLSVTEKEGGIVALQEKNILFTDSQKRFSLNVPEEYLFQSISEDEFLVKDKNNNSIFQLTLTFLEGEIKFTQEEIERDIPGMTISLYKAISLPGIDGGEFIATRNGVETYEMWFLKDTFLYQASSYPQYAEYMRSIIETIQFLKR